MLDYDIGEAFARIENELISSMFRNFKRHRAEETKEGYNWEMWQTIQLKVMEEYRRKNKKKFSKEFASLNARIDEFQFFHLPLLYHFYLNCQYNFPPFFSTRQLFYRTCAYCLHQENFRTFF